VYSFTTTHAVWQYSNAGQLMYSHDNRNNRKTNYVYLQGSLLATREAPMSGGDGTYTVKYQHTDALGSPIKVTDAAGVTVETSEYEPYGHLANRALTDGPGFTGHVQDAETGLTHMQQRYFDSQLGIFLSVDPVSAVANPVGVFHRYRYAANNPLKFTDPDGRCYYSKQDGSCYTDKEVDDYMQGEPARVLNTIGSPLGIAADVAGGDYTSAATGAILSVIPGGEVWCGPDPCIYAASFPLSLESGRHTRTGEDSFLRRCQHHPKSGWCRPTSKEY
jgi:RHS repeat-associated protein